VPYLTLEGEKQYSTATDANFSFPRFKRRERRKRRRPRQTYFRKSVIGDVPPAHFSKRAIVERKTPISCVR